MRNASGTLAWRCTIRAQRGQGLPLLEVRVRAHARRAAPRAHFEDYTAARV
jgi:hypothetical protein